MKNIARQTIFLVAAIAVVYLVILGITLVAVRPVKPTGQGLDSAAASRTLYMTEPKYVFLARSALNTPDNKVIILGASNTQVGFGQPLVQSAVQGAVVNNLSIGGANMTEVAQVVDLVQEVQSPAARAHTIYVIGMWYGMFCDDKIRWNSPDRVAGDTDIDAERYRYGFFRRTASGPAAVLPPAWLDEGALLIHPYLVLDKLTRDGTKSFRQAFFVRPAERTDAERNATVISPAEQRGLLDYWNTYMGGTGTVSDGQFQSLLRAVDTITASGGRVMLVDLPIPHWHSSQSAYFTDYQQKKAAFWQHLAGRPGITLMEMGDANNDDDYSDEVHPKPRIQPLWAERLAQALKPVIASASAP